MSKELTPKQKLFIYEYLIDLNGTQAAIRAGYSAKSAEDIACENLQKPEIKSMVDQLVAKRMQKLEISGQTVLERLDEIGGVDIGEVFDETNCMKPLKEIPIAVRRTIASIEVLEHWEQGPDGGKVKTGEIKKLKFHPKVQANELLGKNQKLWTDKIEVTDTTNLAERMATARKRSGK